MNTENKNTAPQQNTQQLSPSDKAATQPLTDGQLPEANVGLAGRCIQPAHSEVARPDTGAPCADGRDGK